MVKDIKRSIRDKYKRREAHLYYAIEQYLMHADDRLNEELAGKARDKDKIDAISEKCRELFAEIPAPKEFQIDPNMDIEDLLGENNIEDILKAGKEWFNNLSPEELKKIENYREST